MAPSSLPSSSQDLTPIATKIRFMVSFKDRPPFAAATMATTEADDQNHPGDDEGVRNLEPMLQLLCSRLRRKRVVFDFLLSCCFRHRLNQFLFPFIFHLF
ncbi:hypothetical protein U1Q18_033650 [Sarracenia purpurea var. burkii]